MIWYWSYVLCKHFWSPSQQTKLRHQHCCTGGSDRIKVQQSPGLEEPLFQVSFRSEVSATHGCGKHHLTFKLRRTVCLILKVCALCVCRYTGSTPNPPPGSHYTSPSENMWNTGSAYSMNQGMPVSGEHTQEHWELKQTVHGHSRDAQPWGAGNDGKAHLWV